MLILRQNKALKQLLEKKKLSVKADSTRIVNYQTNEESQQGVPKITRENRGKLFNHIL